MAAGLSYTEGEEAGSPGQEKVLQKGKFIADDVLPSPRKDSLGIEELYEGRE